MLLPILFLPQKSRPKIICRGYRALPQNSGRPGRNRQNNQHPHRLASEEGKNKEETE